MGWLWLWLAASLGFLAGLFWAGRQDRSED